MSPESGIRSGEPPRHDPRVSHADTLEAGRELWAEHLKADYPPRLRATDVDGVSMVMLDADVAGCFTVWLDNGGWVDAWRQGILDECMAELDRVIPLLTDRHERKHFARVREMAAMALGQ
jgi:hypothetical protein